MIRHRFIFLLTAVLLAAPFSGAAGGAVRRFDEGLLGAVRPEGWLLESLQRQADGLTGHPEALSYPYNTCLWAGEIPRNGRYGKAWWRYEQTAYYTDGLLRLGTILHDQDLTAKAAEGIDYVLSHPAENGRLGRDFPEKTHNQWPFAVFFRALQARYEATGDKRIPDALERHYLSFAVDELCLNRNVNSIEGILWTWARTGNSRLLDLAVAVWDRGEGNLTEEKCLADGPVKMHGVTYCEELKLPLLLFGATGDPRYRKSAGKALQKLLDGYMLPDGCPSGCEHLQGKEIRHGHETCDIVDFCWTMGHFLQVLGDARFADLIERATFNAGFGAITKDFKALQYFSCVNQFRCTGNSDHNAFNYGSTWMAYRPTHETECCAGNVNRMLPNYVARMWMRDSVNDGLVATLYGPSSIEWKGLKITEKTNYPFDGRIEFSFSGRSRKMALGLRIPGWCHSWRLTLNGKEYGPALVDGFTTLTRRWHRSDRLVLELPMPVCKNAVPEGVYYTRGPLLYAYPIETEWTEDTTDYPNMHGKVPGNPAFKCWSAEPLGPWNWAVAGDPVSKESSRQVYACPWDLATVPVTIEIPALRIKDWTLREDRFTPENPPVFETDGPVETLRLVPYGATCLRLTVFPSSR